MLLALCFFFQAEDGIRDGTVTGVQTCALPILIAELPHVARALRDEVAVEQIRFFVVNADVKFARALRLETLYRRVAIDRVKFIRLDVAEESLLRVFFGIIRGGEQVVALDFSFEEKRRASGCVRVVTVS